MLWCCQGVSSIPFFGRFIGFEVRHVAVCFSAARTVGRLVSDRHWLEDGMVGLPLTGQSVWYELCCSLLFGSECVQVFFDLFRYCELDVRGFVRNGGGPV